MANDINIRNIDKRTLDRKIAKGAISKEEHEAYLKALPDLQDESENIAELIYGTDSDGDGDGDGSEPEQEA